MLKTNYSRSVDRRVTDAGGYGAETYSDLPIWSCHGSCKPLFLRNLPSKLANSNLSDTVKP